MAQKRSIFEEVGERAAQPAPQGGLIDAGRRGARRGIRLWLLVLFALVVAMIPWLRGGPHEVLQPRRLGPGLPGEIERGVALTRPGVYVGRVVLEEARVNRLARA